MSRVPFREGEDWQGRWREGRSGDPPPVSSARAPRPHRQPTRSQGPCCRNSADPEATGSPWRPWHGWPTAVSPVIRSVLRGHINQLSRPRGMTMHYFEEQLLRQCEQELRRRAERYSSQLPRRSAGRPGAAPDGRSLGSASSLSADQAMRDTGQASRRRGGHRPGGIWCCPASARSRGGRRRVISARHDPARLRGCALCPSASGCPSARPHLGAA
jgi:hypothetical protein